MRFMTIHREGYRTLLLVGAALILINLLLARPLGGFYWGLLILSVAFYLFILQFFRNPVRNIAVVDNQLIYAPADGRIVAIEETEETEYFREKRLQVSIFMTPLNVHVNRNPLSGEVKYVRHHPGKYLVAAHPKSSAENERTTVVIDSGRFETLVRQVAGAVARRIVTYVHPGDRVEQGGELGFIKFGSRVDVVLPLNAEVLVDLEQEVRGNITVLARV